LQLRSLDNIIITMLSHNEYLTLLRNCIFG
jgi:hypothetical protein